ncbi:hypothetical protein V2J09_017986 [Rumex salicifolius]
MVALYFPSLTAPNAGFGFEDDHIFAEDFNTCYFAGDDVYPPPKQQYVASSNLDPYPFWDVDHMIIPPSSCGGEGLRHLSSPAVSSGYSGKTAGSTEEASVAGKKHNHNASERMRRMKINGLYASLRALLPNSHHMKKLSIPNTVDRVVKYIPELQKEVQVLVHRKEQLLPESTPNSVNFSLSQAASDKKSCSTRCSSSVQATRLGNGQISVQISTPKSFLTTLIPISEVLREVEEEDGLVVIDVSSSESAVERVFHHFHLMALQASQKVINCELLKEKVLSQCHMWEQLCLWMISQGL